MSLSLFLHLPVHLWKQPITLLKDVGKYVFCAAGSKVLMRYFGIGGGGGGTD